MSGFMDSLFGAIPALLTGGFGFLGQQSANDTNVSNASAANATSVELANTAHQREVADLSEAGLNPILSATHGGIGAATPQQAVAHVESAATPGISSALSAATLKSSLDKMQAEAEAARGTAHAQESIANINNTVAGPKAIAETSMYTASAAEATKRLGLIEEQINQTMAQARESGGRYDLNRGQLLRISFEAEKLAAETRGADAQAALARIRTKLDTLDVPRATVESDVYKGGNWWKEHISPYLSDTGKVVSSAASLAGAGGLGYKLGKGVAAGAAGSAALRPSGMKEPFVGRRGPGEFFIGR
jgi:hypothetical protein